MLNEGFEPDHDRHRAGQDDWSGMIHNNQSGIPEFPRAILVGGGWVDRKTCSRRQHATKSVAVE